MNQIAMPVEAPRLKIAGTYVRASVLQRPCTWGQHTSGGECEGSKKHRKSILQRAAINPSAVYEVPPIVHEVLPSPGQSPEASTDFAHDFSSMPAQTDGAQILQRRAAQNPGTGNPGSGGTGTGHPQLQDCSTWPSASSLSSVLTLSQTTASQAVQGLQSLVGHWGTPSTSALDRATEMGLRKGFNMEPDKSTWSIIGIPETEIRSADRRDRAAAQTILDNFRQIVSDAPHYQGAPACQNRLVTGSPCLGCVAATHPRCQRGAVAWVRHETIGQPSSPIFFCPTFFTGNAQEMAEVFLHEVAHLQPFGASDAVRGTRYYGCPVNPIDAFNQMDETLPGLLDPNDYLQVADSYRCFMLTQREHKAAYEREERIRRRIEQETRDVTQPSPGRTP